MRNLKQGGLLPLPPDDRDLNLGYIEKLPALETLPESFTLGDTIVRDQGADNNDDLCTAYGSVGMAYLMDGVEGSPEWVFAASKEISGDPERWGQNMRDAFKAWVKYGSPRREHVVAPQDKAQRRELKNYDQGLKGDELKKQTYVTTKGPYKAFENIKATIWKYKDEKRAVGIGIIFAWPLSDVYLRGVNESGFGHFMFATGWEGEYLEVVNSYGKDAGKNGKHYIHKDTINYFVKKYGAFCFIDMPAEEARAKQAEYLSLINRLIRFLKNLWQK